MEEYIIDFRDIDWEVDRPGMRSKAAIHGDQKLRMIEYTKTPKITEWCTLGHLGYVLEGKLVIRFARKVVHFNAGDGVFIPYGTKHKARVEKGKKAVVVFVERVDTGAIRGKTTGLRRDGR